MTNDSSWKWEIQKHYTTMKSAKRNCSVYFMKCHKTIHILIMFWGKWLPKTNSTIKKQMRKSNRHKRHPYSMKQCFIASLFYLANDHHQMSVSFTHVFGQIPLTDHFHNSINQDRLYQWSPEELLTCMLTCGWTTTSLWLLSAHSGQFMISRSIDLYCNPAQRWILN